jgi:nitrogen PTS system EIIA component
MPLNDIIGRDAVIPVLRVSNKKQLLEAISEKASKLTGLPARAIFDLLLQRERLGTTGLGNGIAIPHCKVEGLDHLIGIFARLEKPIDFEGVDGQPVDLVFIILAPEGAGADHLKGLSKVARVLRDQATAEKLRKITDADAIYSLLTTPTSQPKAA